MGRLQCWAGSLALGFTLVAPAYAASGTIIQSHGAASMERGGSVVPAVQGLELLEGDAIDVAPSSRVQLRLEDDSLFALPGDTKVKLDSLRMPSQGERGSFILSLVRGGFRTVTGLIGKMKGDTYRVTTAMATIGVRGSSYSALICDDGCATKTRFRAGLYVKAHDGQIFVRNSGGQVRLRVGQTAFTASVAEGPVLVKTSPLDSPEFALGTSLDADFELDMHPPRIEPEPPASPS